MPKLSSEAMRFQQTSTEHILGICYTLEIERSILKELTGGAKCLIAWVTHSKELRLLNYNFTLHSKNIIAKIDVTKKKKNYLILFYFQGIKIQTTDLFIQKIYTKELLCALYFRLN